MFIPKYDLTKGFPGPWITSLYEKELASHIYNYFFGQEFHGLIVNCTWGGSSGLPGRHDSKFKQVKKCMKKADLNVVLFFNFVDDFDETWRPIIQNCIKKLGKDNIKVIGHSPWENDFNFQFWPLALNRYFKQYSETDIKLEKIKHRFLCYNRKPHEHRVKLYKRLKNKNLLKHGVFTLGNNNHKDSISFEKNGFGGMTDAFEVDSDNSYAIPNDLMSLGNIEIWKNSLLNIITETNYQTQGIPFLTEKTFKPIIGMRPFLILGPDGTIEWLHSNGFMTFNKDFNLPMRDLNIDDVVSAIKKLSIDNVNMKEIQKKTEHNRKRFFEFCREEEKRIGIG